MSSRLYRSLSLVTVAAVIVALALPARAEEGRDKEAKHTKDKRHWTGMLESVDATAGTCTVKKMGKDKKEESKTFKCAADCKVTGADDKPATMAALKTGDKVTITYTQDGDKLTCVAMEVKPAKAKAEKAEKAEKSK